MVGIQGKQKMSIYTLRSNNSLPLRGVFAFYLAGKIQANECSAPHLLSSWHLYLYILASLLLWATLSITILHLFQIPFPFLTQGFCLNNFPLSLLYQQASLFPWSCPLIFKRANIYHILTIVVLFPNPL